jgi:hypothetical protein
MFVFRPDPSSSLAQQSNRNVMLIKGGYNLAFHCLDYTPMVLAIRVRRERQIDLIRPETLTLFLEVSYTEYVDSFGNQCMRLIAPPGCLSIWNRFGLPAR